MLLPVGSSASTSTPVTSDYSTTNNVPMADNGNEGSTALVGEVESLRKQLASLEVRCIPSLSSCMFLNHGFQLLGG